MNRPCIGTDRTFFLYSVSELAAMLFVLFTQYLNPVFNFEQDTTLLHLHLLSTEE